MSSSSPWSLLMVSCNDSALLLGVELKEEVCEKPSVEDGGDESADDCGGGVGILSRCWADVAREWDFGVEDKGGEAARKRDDEERCERRRADVGKMEASAGWAGSVWVVAMAVVRGVEVNRVGGSGGNV